MINLTRLITEREPTYSRMTALKCFANFVSFLLSVACISLFVAGLKNPDIYSRRQGLKLGCFLMILDQLVTGWGWIIEHSQIIPIIFICSLQISVITWFAIICYKWEIDEIRKNIIVNVGVPVAHHKDSRRSEYERDKSPDFGRSRYWNNCYVIHFN